MRAVITVTGKDRTGIIAKISNTLYEHQVNIIDISQNVIEDVFAMVIKNPEIRSRYGFPDCRSVPGRAA